MLNVGVGVAGVEPFDEEWDEALVSSYLVEEEGRVDGLGDHLEKDLGFLVKGEGVDEQVDDVGVGKARRRGDATLDD